ncbi:basic proline-rich protein-like [Heterocephalus glaber]|uniref:Basic proline-rich protein-like n=1 Tax=Heterocephalus glaber TaxID=10181 RepID=A0AAX6R1H7_HETGA|nr:basic proline-rich protein-like [Heterocephalus glaber]
MGISGTWRSNSVPSPSLTHRPTRGTLSPSWGGETPDSWRALRPALGGVRVALKAPSRRGAGPFPGSAERAKPRARASQGAARRGHRCGGRGGAGRGQVRGAGAGRGGARLGPARGGPDRPRAASGEPGSARPGPARPAPPPIASPASFPLRASLLCPHPGRRTQLGRARGSGSPRPTPPSPGSHRPRTLLIPLSLPGARGCRSRGLGIAVVPVVQGRARAPPPRTGLNRTGPSEPRAKPGDPAPSRPRDSSSRAGTCPASPRPPCARVTCGLGAPSPPDPEPGGDRRGFL